MIDTDFRNPYPPVSPTPQEFERHVERMLRESGIGLTDFRVQRLERISGADGTYEIDVTARFDALGVQFLVLVECKHHKVRVKREVVQILHDRIRSVGAHKGMMFGTGGFQRGAVEYAKAHGIALVTVADGSTSYETKSIGGPKYVPSGPPTYIGWLVSTTADGNERYARLDDGRPEFLLEALTAAGQ